MKPDPLKNLRIASPCPMNWDQMTGDNRARFCSLCNLHVYNIAELTRKQAVALISETEGRICGRIHRRSDGTVITKIAQSACVRYAGASRELRERFSRRL